MGMAASQARLLTITARLADNELRSQTINNAKMRLATQSAQASDNYINALNNATYRFSNYDSVGTLLTQPLTFNALTAYSPYNTQYGLVNAANQLLVSEAEAKIFDRNKDNLNAYLKEHGLSYDTTYFDKFNEEPRVNKAYPANLFGLSGTDDEGLTLDGDTLKKFYEEYGSYESSIEVENYEKAYSNYVSIDKELKKYGSQILEKYLLNNMSNIEKSNSMFNLKNLSGNAAAKLQTLYNVFGYSKSGDSFDSNSIIKKLENNNILNVKTEGFLKDYLKSLELIGSDLKISITETLEYTENDDNSKTYKYEGLKITVDENGNITNVDGELEKRLDGATVDGVYNPGETNGGLVKFFSTIVHEQTYNDNGGTRVFSYSYDPVHNELTKTYASNDPTDVDEAINGVVTDVINSILRNANYSNLCQILLKDPNALGIIPAEYNIDSNRTLEDLLNDYSAAQKEFIISIFGEDNLSAVLDDIKAGNKEVTIHDAEGHLLDENGNITDDVNKAAKILVTTDQLEDIDFVLQYMKQYQYTPSENFETVIKHYLVQDLIKEYGTPKYAWVDENDKTSNQENADTKAQWYTNLFKRMQQGYKVLEDGLASSPEWIEYALESGTVYMEQVDSSFVWNALDYKTCTKITEETDDVAVARAEAEYNRAMNDIKTKDNFYDLELKNIDTEHNALQTEYDVIKGVINKNIERNFKFNQSA